MNSVFSTTTTGPWPEPPAVEPARRTSSSSPRSWPRWSPTRLVTVLARLGTALGLLLLAWAMVVLLFCVG